MKFIHALFLCPKKGEIGASDIAGCPRKIILQKLEPQKPSLTTLLRFSRGHLAENVVKKALKNSDTSSWEYQKELVHSRVRVSVGCPGGQDSL